MDKAINYKKFEIRKQVMEDKHNGKITKYAASNHKCYQEWWTTHFYSNTIKDIKSQISKYTGK